MNTAARIFALTWVLNIVCGSATAQQPAPPVPVPAPATAPAAPPATPTTAATPAVQSTPQIDAGEPRANGGAPAGGARGQTSGTGAVNPRGNAADRLNLNTTTVTGDREQPKVMYVVPWKSASIGDLSGKPMNSLLDEVLAPVDREEFRREVAYYDAVTAPVPKNGEGKPPAAQSAR